MSNIRNRKEVAIPIDFKISNGKIGGTDIDFVLEFDNKFLILVEIKRGDVDVPIGQRLVLSRMMDAWRETGRRGAVIVASYDHTDKDGFINLHNCKVNVVYDNSKQWKSEKVKGVPIIKLINEIGKHWGCRKCKF